MDNIIDSGSATPIADLAEKIESRLNTKMEIPPMDIWFDMRTNTMTNVQPDGPINTWYAIYPLQIKETDEDTNRIDPESYIEHWVDDNSKFSNVIYAKKDARKSDIINAIRQAYFKEDDIDPSTAKLVWFAVPPIEYVAIVNYFSGNLKGDITKEMKLDDISEESDQNGFVLL